MEKKQLKDFIKIYKVDNRWIVDYTAKVYSEFPLNLSFSDQSREDALYKALIYLAIEFMKYSDLDDMISNLYEKTNSNLFGKEYEDLRFPNLETIYEFIKG